MRAEKQLKPSRKSGGDTKTAIKDLEQRLARRTAELEAAHKELQDFSYSISHDLRAPLRAVNGFSRIVLEEFGSQLPEEARRHLERVRSAGERMGELIEGLLTFSHSGRQSLKQETVNSIEVAQSALEELNSEQNGRQIDLRIGKLSPCKADPMLFRQVWINLFSNAIKFTRDRTPAIIEAGSTREKGEVVYFVRDNGAGFDMQYSNKLFGMFQRLHRADEFAGLGIGLAVAQRIIHRHGGRIWAEGKVDEGATFFFTVDGNDI